GGGWGWGGWGWGPGPYYGEPAAGAIGYAMASGMGALDMNVKPKKAEVWVDGRYVADARDLDGDPSYLWLKQGTHHLVVYMSGYRSYERDVDIHVGVIRELKVVLEKGESQPPVPAPPSPPVARGETPPEGAEPLGAPAPPRVEAEPEAGPHGTLGLRVQPPDATVYVDGQYRGTARDLRRMRLPAGHHRIELVRPGFQAVDKEVDLQADRTVDLDVSLERSGGWKY
ncbi:MAG TPA: PEGA domain-containing protein, partial [Vicinamibacteria bacterium]|nr:PEGA domain-containing protein [Vicinamibacteria bacterium]